MTRFLHLTMKKIIDSICYRKSLARINSKIISEQTIKQLRSHLPQFIYESKYKGKLRDMQFI